MKATIDVPDALYRRVKANAALEGRAIREVTIELYERWLEDTSSLAAGVSAAPSTARPATSARQRPSAAGAWLKRWDAIGLEVRTKAVDPRPTSETLQAERR